MQHRKTKYLWAAVCMLLLLTVLSACGGQPAANKSNGSANVQSTEAAAPAESSAATAAEESAGTRTVSTAKGEVEIPAHPQRIVALYYHHMLLALGEKPVGANLTWWGGSPYLKDQEAGITDVGGPPSLEAVAKLEPDLILINDNSAEDYDKLSKIAPTVWIPYDGKRNAYDDAKLVADILGKPDVAEQLKSRFEEAAAAERAKLSGIVGPDTSAAIIRIEGKGSQFAVFGDNYGRGGWPIYHGLNFKVPEKIQKDLIGSGTQIVQQLSMEQLPEYVADADYLFVSNEGEGTDLVKDSGIWKSIPAVKNNKVFELGKDYFFFDPISIEGQLQSITDMLLSQK